MSKLEQIRIITDQVFNLEMTPVTAIQQIAQLLDEPISSNTAEAAS